MLDKSHRELDIVIGMYILLKISLVVCSGKLTVLAVFAGIGLKDFI